jgi:plasmid stability protein
MSATLSVPDLDGELMLRLKRRASRHGHSAEAEVGDILRTALAGERECQLADGDGRGFDELAAELRAQTAGRILTPSEVLLRESRDER